MNRQAQIIFKAVLCNTTRADTCPDTFVNTHRMYSTNTNYGFGVMVCQCSFIDFNTGNTVVLGVDSGRGCACVGARET